MDMTSERTMPLRKTSPIGSSAFCSLLGGFWKLVDSHCKSYFKDLPGNFPERKGDAMSGKNVFFEGRGSFFKEPVLAGTAVQPVH